MKLHRPFDVIQTLTRTKNLTGTLNGQSKCKLNIILSKNINNNDVLKY